MGEEDIGMKWICIWNECTWDVRRESKCMRLPWLRGKREMKEREGVMD